MSKTKKTKKRRSKTRIERNDVEYDRVPFKHFKVNLMGTSQSFEFRDRDREDMSLDRLKYMIRPKLRLKGDETIDILWSEEACTPMSLYREEEFKYCCDNTEIDDNGWSKMYMQGIESSKDGDDSSIICEIVLPHKYLSPVKNRAPNKPVSKGKHMNQYPKAIHPLLQQQINQSPKKRMRLLVQEEVQGYQHFLRSKLKEKVRRSCLLIYQMMKKYVNKLKQQIQLWIMTRKVQKYMFLNFVKKLNEHRKVWMETCLKMK